VHGFATLVVDGALPMSARERTAAFQVLARNLLLGLGGDPGLAPLPDAAPLLRFMEEKAKRMSAMKARKAADGEG
jgi:hypothetical protein